MRHNDANTMTSSPPIICGISTFSTKSIFSKKCFKCLWQQKRYIIGKTSSWPFFKKKKIVWGKSKWSGAQFQYLLIVLNLAYNKNKPYKTLDYWSRDMLNFDFLEKGLYDFLRKMFVMLYSINWPNFIVW